MNLLVKFYTIQVKGEHRDENRDQNRGGLRGENSDRNRDVSSYENREDG